MHSPTGRMVDASHFAMVPRTDVPRSAFDIQHTHKTTFNSGWLVPVYVDEVLPGDSYRLKMTALARLSTPIVPIMDNVMLESFFFFVPNRLLWENWERFMGDRATITDTTTFLTPYVELLTADLAPGTIGDWFGLTLNNSANTLRVQAMPFRAYNLIYNEWFRDQDLVNPLTVPTGDGPDAAATYLRVRRGKRHDYFTTARPWPNKPFNIDQLPSSTTYAEPGGGAMNAGFRAFLKGPFASEGIGAPIVGFGVASGTADAGAATIREPAGRTGVYGGSFTSGFTARTNAGGVFPDIRVLVNDLRTAVMVQGMLERNARGGTRYTELVRSHFGVISPDARLQRPEYLGGGRTMISINPVAQTSASGVAGTTTVLGELAAIGTAMAHGHGFSQSFTEHGWILGLVNIRADMTYQQGNARMWNRRTQFDFYWPGLAHLGEQAIYSQEIYADGSSADVSVFGYQERWAEYKYMPSRTSGHMRSTNATPLDIWHLGQEFASRPVLDNIFIAEFAPFERVLQVDYTESQFLGDFYFNIRKVRPMPMYSIPGVGARL